MFAKEKTGISCQKYSSQGVIKNCYFIFWRFVYARDTKGYAVLLEKKFTVGAGTTSSGIATQTGTHQHDMYAAYSWDNGVITQPPTATATGIRTYTCYCGATKTETIPKLTGYTIRYDANGGSGAPAAQTKMAGQTLTLSRICPQRTGYVFLGWSSIQNAASPVYGAGGSFTSDANTTLYAVWQPVRYTVIFDANGGNGSIPTLEMTYDLPQALPEQTFSRFGYVQTQWCTSPDVNLGIPIGVGEEPIGTGLNLSTQDGGTVKLYAIWEKASITSSVYTIDTEKKLVGGFAEGTAVEAFLARMEPVGLLLLRDGTAYSGNTVATGLTVEYRINGATVDALTLVLAGDVNGDGRITATDYLVTKRAILKLSSLSGVYAEAGDYNGSGDLTAVDYILLKRHVLFGK